MTGRRPWVGAAFALAAAALFGLSTPLAKPLLTDTSPVVIAALLYLGAGAGLAVLDGALRLWGAPRAPRLAGRQWRWLLISVVTGGIVGPLLLMTGLQRTTASTASLLLNIEAPLTALFAWSLFGERFGSRTLAGLGLMFVGAVLVSWQGTPSLSGLIGPLAVLGACASWALDNNLVRRIANADPVQIATLRGMIAGAFNVVVAIAFGLGWPESLGAITAAAAVGFLGYGVSLVLFVLALRDLGAARTAALFSTGPFIGAVAAIVVLGDPVTIGVGAAGLVMATGAWLMTGTTPSA